MSAYAGWAGSLTAEVVDQRLGLMQRNSRLPVDEWAPALIDTLVGDGASADVVEELRSIIAEFHPAATRVALQAFAEADLQGLLARIQVPTLLLYGEQDVRTPRQVWEPLHSKIRGSKLALIPDVGHMVNIEAAERVNAEIRSFAPLEGLVRSRHGT